MFLRYQNTFVDRCVTGVYLLNNNMHFIDL